jgi:hypothetical protein
MWLSATCRFALPATAERRYRVAPSPQAAAMNAARPSLLGRAVAVASQPHRLGRRAGARGAHYSLLSR